jgi:ATP-binding cassette subfamily B (MDR/TAP) protein 1
LGQSQDEDDLDEEQVAERVALVRTQTRASGFEQAPDRSAKDGVNYNLINCVFIVLKEQGHLWKYFVVLAIATLAGGKLARPITLITH